MGFKRSSGYLLALMVGNLVTGLIVTVIVARHLGAEGKGVIHLVVLLPQFVTSLGGLGIRAAAVYFTGRGRSPRTVFRAILLVGGTLAVLYTGSGWILRDLLASTIFKGIEPRWILVSLALIPPSILWSYCDGLLQGLFRFGAYAIIQLLSLALKLSLLLLFLVVMDRGVAWGIAAYVIALVLPALLAIGWARIAARREGEPVMLREILTYGFKVYWGMLAQRANLRLDMFLVNPYVGTAAVGVYSISTTLAELIWQVPGAIAQVLLPTVARSSEQEAIRMTALVSRFTFLFSMTAAIGLALTARWILLIFPPKFADALVPLWGLLPGVVALSVSMTMAGYLTGTGRPMLNSTASLIAFIVNVPALFLLVPRMGILGASLATSIAYVVQTGVVLYFYGRESGAPVSAILVPRRADFQELRALGMGAWRRLRTGPGGGGAA